MEYTIKKNATGVSLALWCAASESQGPLEESDETQFAAQYWRPNEEPQAITLVAVSHDVDPWEEGGFRMMTGGWYRLDIPDAALAEGADCCAVALRYTPDNVAADPVLIHLVDADDADLLLARQMAANDKEIDRVARTIVTYDDDAVTPLKTQTVSSTTNGKRISG